MSGSASAPGAEVLDALPEVLFVANKEFAPANGRAPVELLQPEKRIREWFQGLPRAPELGSDLVEGHSSHDQRAQAARILSGAGGPSCRECPCAGDQRLFEPAPVSQTERTSDQG